MTVQRLTVATRRSKLALAQTRVWMKQMSGQYPHLQLEELQVTTTGDKVQDRALADIGGKGLFIKEIEEALLDGRADVAVHSMKDVPAEIASALTIGCVPEREDPRDVMATRTGCRFEELPRSSRVGTSSLRRTVQLLARRPDLQIMPLRGNVDTRLRRCQEGRVDAVVLARAGLVRLGLADRATEVLDPEVCLPAIGQGALAIEHRQGNDQVAALLAPLNHAPTAITVAAERGVMWAVEGSCKIPVGAHAVRHGDALQLRAMLAEEDGSRLRRRELNMAWPHQPSEAYQAGVELGRVLREVS